MSVQSTLPPPPLPRRRGPCHTEVVPALMGRSRRHRPQAAAPDEAEAAEEVPDPQGPSTADNNNSAAADHHLVYIVYDKSGSMSHVVGYIDTELRRWEARPEKRAELHFVPFSAETCHCLTVEHMPEYMNSTNIVPAFGLVREVMAQGPSHEATVVFISDGADNDPPTVAARLREVGGPPPNVTRCALFAVAVGEGFPTGTLVDALRGWVVKVGWRGEMAVDWLMTGS